LSMPEPRILINGEESVPIDRRVITIGRAADNVISFPDDSNVSRYHAEIENRGDGDYWLFDLNSSNGTRLNGEPVSVEKPLFDGDSIEIGGSQMVEIVLSDRADEQPKEEEPEEEDQAPEEEVVEEPAEGLPEAPKSKLTALFIIAGLAIGLALISILIVAAIFLSGGGGGSAGGGGLFGSGCEATAEIRNPQNGDILNEVTTIELDIQDPTECVKSAAYLIDGTVVATSETFPFSASLDPNNFPGLSDGLDHNLKVTLIDADGNEAIQSKEIALNFDTLVTETPSPTPGQDGPGNGGGTQTGPDVPGGPKVSLTDTKTMAESIIPQFSGRATYVTGNPGFLDSVNRLTAEYADAGFYQRALKYRDVINTEFIQERGLDPPLGYVLAMSRSRFMPTNDQKGAGLWRMDNNLVKELGYNGLCGTETIASEKQSCAAIAASNYVKDLILKAFGGNSGDIIYVIAAFGLSPLEAAEWRQRLPENRQDFWTVLAADPQKQDQVARFFAAAIVAENPARFGLQDDKPLSTLYRAFMSAPAAAAN